MRLVRIRYSTSFRALGSLTFSLLLLAGCASTRHVPSVDGLDVNVGEIRVLSPTDRHNDKASLVRHESGLWELYVAGNPFQRGLAIGQLTEDLLQKQEAAFVDVIRNFVPSEARQRRLGLFLRFFNRNMEKHVIKPYRQELYGLSMASSPAFDFIAPPYHRLLYFHGAHDIGHALQDLALVGCSSFAVWDSQAEDGKLLVGRNFDFHVNDAFAENKIVYFIAPEEGYKHAIVSWAGMLGAMSGMNEHGLTVTINAGKSNIPLQSKTPISFVAREILQYAENIDRAYEIASRREVFVSESIMVASAADGQAVLIEVSPKKIGLYAVPQPADLLVCTNHFQSEPYLHDNRNLRQIRDGHSQYRFDRLHELIGEHPKLTPALAADILRDRGGLNGETLGHGNEMAINQLMAHHAVVFQPHDRLMWVSANPYQLGAFVAYDLRAVFDQMGEGTVLQSSSVDSLQIGEDGFLYTPAYRNYRTFRKETVRIGQNNAYISDEDLTAYVALNPEFWWTYRTVGDYYFRQKNYVDAARYYEQALTKVVTTPPDRTVLEKRLRQARRKAKNR